MNLVPQKRFMEHVSGTYSIDVRRSLREIEVSRVFAYERLVPIPTGIGTQTFVATRFVKEASPSLEERSLEGNCWDRSIGRTTDVLDSPKALCSNGTEIVAAVQLTILFSSNANSNSGCSEELRKN